MFTISERYGFVIADPPKRPVTLAVVSSNVFKRDSTSSPKEEETSVAENNKTSRHLIFIGPPICVRAADGTSFRGGDCFQKNRITYGELLPGLRGRRANDGDVEVTGDGIRLFRRQNKGRMRNDGFSGFLMLYGCGVCLMDGGAERTIRAGGCVFVMVELEPE